MKWSVRYCVAQEGLSIHKDGAGHSSNLSIILLETKTLSTPRHASSRYSSRSVKGMEIRRDWYPCMRTTKVFVCV